MDQKQDGFTLLGVMIALGLLGIFVTAYLSGFLNINKASRAVDSKLQYVALENALLGEISSLVHDINPTTCLPPSLIANRAFGYGSSNSALKFTRSIPPRSTAPHIQAARNRCTKPEIIDASTVNSLSHVYFCMQLTPSNQDAFVEISLKMEHARSGGSIPCSQAANDPNAIARVAYGIYFQGTEHSHRYGTAIYKMKN